MSKIDEAIKKTMEYLSDLNDQIAKMERDKFFKEKLNIEPNKMDVVEIETTNTFLKAGDGSWVRIDAINYLYTKENISNSWDVCANMNSGDYSLFEGFKSENEAQAFLDILVKNLYGDKNE